MLISHEIIPFFSVRPGPTHRMIFGAMFCFDWSQEANDVQMLRVLLARGADVQQETDRGGKTMGKPWEKPWENGKLIKKNAWNKSPK